MAEEGNLLSQSLWLWVAGQGNTGCQPPWSGLMPWVAIPMSCQLIPCEGLKSGDPFLEGLQTQLAPFLRRGGVGVSPISSSQNGDTGAGRKAPTSARPVEGVPWKEAMGPGSHLPPENWGSSFPRAERLPQLLPPGQRRGEG